MGIDVLIGVVAAEGAADAAAATAFDVATLTAADVALPGAVADAAAGTLAYAAPEALAMEGAALGTAEGAVGTLGTAAGEGSLLGPGFSSAAELGVGTGAAPVATGAEALGTTGASSTLAGTGVGTAPLGGGVTSALGSVAPAGALPEEALATSPFSTDLAATGSSAQLSGESSLASQSVLQPSQLAGNAVGEGSQGLTSSEITSGAAQGGNVASQAGSQDVLSQLGVQQSGLNTPPAGQLASASTQATASDAITPEMEAAAKGGGQVATAPTTTTMSTPATTETAVAQTPASYNAQGALPSMAQQAGVPTAAPAVPAATAPASVAPAAQVGTSIGEGSSGLTASEITSGAGTTGASQAAGAAGSQGFGGKALDYLAKNPSLLLSGAGLLGNMLMQPDIPKFQPQLNAAAQNMQAQGQQLASYLSTGTLPPGVQAQMNAAHEAALATVRSQHAARGTSGSSMEAQDIQRINETIVSQGASIATSLLQAGINEQQMANGIYTNLMNSALQQDQQMSQAISGFTNAMASGAARNMTPVG